jgi:hypothetical protein
MIQCVKAYRENHGYRLSSETEPEDWDELLEEVEGEPELIEHVRASPPYTHAYRMPNGAV